MSQHGFPDSVQSPEARLQNVGVDLRPREPLTLIEWVGRRDYRRWHRP